MITASIPENSSEADLSRLARMVMSLFDRWNLSSEDQAFLLGLATGKVLVSVRREISTSVLATCWASIKASAFCFQAIATSRTAG